MSEDAGLLRRVAERAMRERGFLCEPPPEALAAAKAAAAEVTSDAKDLTGLPWSSIDNPESRDLDQVEVIEKVDGGYRLLVGIADVEAFVPEGSPVDRFAAHNSVTVYTGARVFPMIPESLCFDATSLLPGKERLAVVIETLVSEGGELTGGDAYPARVKNGAKLDYPKVSAWLDGRGPMPEPLAADATLLEQVQLQEKAAKALDAARRRAGALDVDTAEVRLGVDEQGRVTGVVKKVQDHAGNIIEELMIASNRTVARTLDARGQPSIRRVVREPERWARIVDYAAQRHGKLPQKPSPVALSSFVAEMRRTRTLEEFEEVSLALIKLIGRGEYAAHAPGAKEIGHFGLATAQYAHATAPNRRYADLLTQRALKGTRRYKVEQLSAIAQRCSEREKDAQKVERQVTKSAAALFVRDKVGTEFDAVVTGSSAKGVFVRLLSLPVEGRVTKGDRGLEVGDKVRMRLVGADPERGHIDFAHV